MKSPKYFARTKICMQEQTQCSSRNYKFARSITSEYFKNRPFERFFDFVGKGARLARAGGRYYLRFSKNSFMFFEICLSNICLW